MKNTAIVSALVAFAVAFPVAFSAHWFPPEPAPQIQPAPVGPDPAHMIHQVEKGTTDRILSLVDRTDNLDMRLQVLEGKKKNTDD